MINVTFPQHAVKPKLSVRDLVDGRAYIVTNNAFGVPNNQVFICNKYRDIALFSLDGRTVIAKDAEDAEDYEFEEVDLEVQVNRN